MNEEDIELLKKNGWDVVCQSPFEIEYRDDRRSCASGLAAEIVLIYLQDED